MTSKKGSKKSFPLWGHAVCLVGAYLGAGVLIAVVLSGWPVALPGRGGDDERRVPPPEPLPDKFIPHKRLVTSQLFNGVTFRSKFETEEGRTATVERDDPESYLVELAVRLKVPRANATLEQLSTLNAGLGRMLPGLPDLLTSVGVSDFYHGLYERKVKDVQSNIEHLEQILSRHNFFDCETILELRHPRTGRKVLLVQSEMDVVTDGSDADRTTEVDSNSQFYQPFTSYKWKKRSDRVSPFVTRRQAKVSELESERGRSGTATARKREIESQIRQLKLEISELKNYSFLVARADPFIVLPGFMLRTKAQPYTPEVGDYAVVIFGDTFYPAIFGDVGPSHKIGEASLRLTKQIDPKSTANSRPVDDLKVTYLIFPHSADKPTAPPDYNRWREHCSKLLEEIGGYQGTLFAWENILAPPVPPPAEIRLPGGVLAGAGSAAPPGVTQASAATGGTSSTSAPAAGASSAPGDPPKPGGATNSGSASPTVPAPFFPAKG